MLGTHSKLMLAYLFTGYKAKEIAQNSELSEQSVFAKIRTAKKHLGARNKAQVGYAIWKKGLLEDPEFLTLLEVVKR